MIAQGRSQLPFPYQQGDGCRFSIENNMEAVVAYKESFIRQLYEKAGFRIIEPIGYGVWCGRTVIGGFQDEVIAIKN